MNGTILIVDDEQPIRKLLTQFLVTAGYDCYTAEDTEAAKKELAARDFDLLLSDLKMPGDSGLELIRYAKEHYPQVGRIMVTGFGSPEIAGEVMDIGVYGYIIKPLSRNVVLITVENSLRHMRLDMHMEACRVELEQKVSRRTEKLVAIMDHLQAGVIMVDTDFHIIEMNRAMERWFSLISNEDWAPCFQALVDENREEPCSGCPMADTLREGKTNDVLRQLKTSQGIKEFRIVTTPIRDKFDNIYAGLALYDDITERIALEKDLRQAQKLEAVGQLAAGIAHEINTPIQYVGDNISFLKEAIDDISAVLKTYDSCWQELWKDGVIPEDMNKKLEEEIEKADLDYLWQEIPETVSQSMEGVKRINKIVRAMKDFSHPGDEEMKVADINKILESTITVCRNEWKYVAEMEQELALDLPSVPCFSGEISQVFLNIIVNGAHAIDQFTDGGKKGKGKITVSTRALDDELEIRISDTGGGIPENIRDRIFEPFYTTKERGKGTGQGLAIAHRVVVEKHQGRLFLESEVGTGTTFVVLLPLQPGK